MIHRTFLKEKYFYLLIALFLISCDFDLNSSNTLAASEKSTSDYLEYNKNKQESIGFLEQSLIDQNLIDIQIVAPAIMVDLKYSGTDNFFQKDVYSVLTKAYLPMSVADKLKSASDYLQSQRSNYRLLVYDAVRPHSVQEILWDALDSIPSERRKAFVADPMEGSLHNFGCAVDLTIFDITADTVLDMGTKYDYFGFLAYPRKEQEMLDSGLLSAMQIVNRVHLRNAMQAAGFKPINSEWWHFNSLSLEEAKAKYPLIQ